MNHAGHHLPKRINLALQGGGSHGALTWGVLERLLEEPGIHIEGVSGASAGAINGALMVYGLAAGGGQTESGRAMARSVLAEFWRRIGESSAFGILEGATGHGNGGGSGWLGGDMIVRSMEMLTQIFSPYQLNPLNINPLRDLLERSIDYATLRKSRDVKLFVAATQVLKGAMRVFETHEVGVDELMASACLPFLFQAVEIAGEPYWDGGYLGNPTLYPLIQHCHSQDIVIVQINPSGRHELPRDAAAIADRINEISFNAVLQAEIAGIELVNDLIRQRRFAVGAKAPKEIHLHRIADEALMERHSAASKASTDPALLAELHAAGRKAAEQWLAANFDALGRRSTFRQGPPASHRHRVTTG